ncbi:hypothetical protein [Tenacibaculum xiamenense]|uniref:hypothetical protein n=1 Tax=Tenacibaculum xiamenense TaxID=1261553 RepID=UPI003893DE83
MPKVRTLLVNKFIQYFKLNLFFILWSTNNCIKIAMYQSPIDLLEISLDELESIDHKILVRLEKRLRLLQIQNENSSFNRDLQFQLLQQLKDPQKRACILFIENHPNFKQFLKTGKCTAPRCFNFKNYQNEIPDGLANFLAPYLEDYFIPVFKSSFQNKNYDIINQALNNDYIFTREFLHTLYSYVLQQLTILVKVIEQAKPRTLYKKCPQITYNGFINLLNQIPIGLVKSGKIDYVNALLKYYRRTRQHNAEYLKIKYAYRNLFKLEFDNPDVTEKVKEISEIGYEESSYEESHLDYFSGKNLISAIAFIVAIVMFIAKASNSNTRSTSNRTNTYNNSYNSNINTIHENFQTTYLKKLFGRSYILNEVYYDSTAYNLKTGSNPFNLVQKSSKADRPLITIKNTSEKDAFLFYLNKKDSFFYGAFIRSKDSLQCSHAIENEYIFYRGLEFSLLSYENSGEYTFKKMDLTDIQLLSKKFVLFASNDSTLVTINNKGVAFKNILVDTLKNELLTKERVPEDLSIINATKHDFFRKLYKNSKLSSKNSKEIKLKNGANPYPKFFRNRKHKAIEGSPIIIKNKNKKPLIVFNRNLREQRDFAAYVKPNKAIRIKISPKNDTLFFYIAEKLWKNKKGDTIIQLNSNTRKLSKKPFVMSSTFFNGIRFYTDNETIKISM